MHHRPNIGCTQASREIFTNTDTIARNIRQQTTPSVPRAGERRTVSLTGGSGFAPSRPMIGSIRCGRGGGFDSDPGGATDMASTSLKRLALVAGVVASV